VYGDEVVVNGTFDNGTAGWTAGNSALLTVSGGNLLVTNNGTGYGLADQYITTVVGKVYTISGSFIYGGTIPATVTAWDGATLFNNVNLSSTQNVNFTFAATSTSIRIRLLNNSATTTGFNKFDNISVKEVTGGQVSAGTPLLRTAAINEPRLEYDASGNPLGLLIEEARSNLVPYSDLSSGWNWVNTTDIGGAATAPDGTQTATLMRENTAGTAHITLPAVVSASTSTTASIFAKAGGRRYLQLTDSTNQPNWAMFDLEQGVVTEQKASGITATIEPYGNGWYRCKAALTLPASGSTTNFVWGSSILATTNGLRNVYQGDGTSGIYLWGAQVETGAFPTSYIPTSGSTVTRAADFASLPVERFAFNATKGSVVVSVETLMTSGSKGIVSIEGNSSAENIGLFRGANGNLVYEVRSGSTTQAVFSVSPQVNTFKVAYVFANNYFNIAVNGVAQTSNTSGVVPTGLSAILIGGVYTVGDQYRTNGHIKQIQYYPKRLSNTELQLLTQPSASPTMNLTFDGQATSTLVEGLHD
jgi:hypothetical protein